MSTTKQILANRQNALKSTGPRSLQGKSIASQNSLKHGLSSAAAVIPDEDPAEFALHRDQLLAELAPSTPLESILAERLVTLSWRLERTARLQNQTINTLHSKHKNNPFSKLVQSMLPTHSTPHASQIQPVLSLSKGAPQSTTNELGRTIVKDFSDSRVLERLLMYERRLENSLFKTLLEIQRQNLLRQLTPAETCSP